MRGQRILAVFCQAMLCKPGGLQVQHSSSANHGRISGHNSTTPFAKHGRRRPPHVISGLVAGHFGCRQNSSRGADAHGSPPLRNMNENMTVRTDRLRPDRTCQALCLSYKMAPVWGGRALLSTTWAKMETHVCLLYFLVIGSHRTCQALQPLPPARHGRI